MTDRNPQIGLVIGLLAVVALPAAVQIYRAVTPRLAVGPEALIAAAREVDAFWAANFARQFPDAWGRYRTPRLSFDDLEQNVRARNDDYAGYYVNDSQSIHVDLNRDRREGYLLLVLAHEYGHHVQNLSGQHSRFSRQELWSGGETGRRLGVRYELQAECLAGVWAHYAVQRGRLISHRDVENWRGLNFFAGESDTHGSGAQRLRWFNAGFEGGRASGCDTFSPDWDKL